MEIIYPKKLKKWDHIRVIAPARSFSLLSEETFSGAIQRLNEFWLTVSISKHAAEMDCFRSSSVESRIQDLHDAFSDTTVDGILSVVGGYNSNQLLDYIDYNLIRENPKILCGFSDITSLTNAIFQKTGIVWYSGPHFSSWGIKYGFDFSVEYFRKCCMEDGPFSLEPAKQWSDYEWYLDQEKINFTNNEGYWILREWRAKGRLIWGHLPCLHCLQWTQYWPEWIEDVVLFLEMDEEFDVQLFDRFLQSLIQQRNFFQVKALVIGRFQWKTKMTRELLEKIIHSKKELCNIPIIANVDFGHTMPFITYPIGGTAEVISGKHPKITILQH